LPFVSEDGVTVLKAGVEFGFEENGVQEIPSLS
jgi:hypothetical protein